MTALNVLCIRGSEQNFIFGFFVAFFVILTGVLQRRQVQPFEQQKFSSICMKLCSILAYTFSSMDANSAVCAIQVVTDLCYNKNFHDGTQETKLQFWPPNFTVFSKYLFSKGHKCASISVFCIHCRRIILVGQKNLTNTSFSPSIARNQKYLEKDIRKKSSHALFCFVP